MDGQGTKWRRNIAENFNRLNEALECYRQTDKRIYDITLAKNEQKYFQHNTPARSLDLNVTENVCFAVKVKLHTETDVIKTRAELANAERRI